MRVLISDKFSEKGLEILRQAQGLEVDYSPGLKPDELKKAIADADGLIIRSATNVTADVMEAAVKLKAVGRAGVGVDNVDLPVAGKRGIVVMNTPGGNTVATAEHPIAMIMALSRRIPQADNALKNGRWEKSKYVGVEVYRKTLGVLGFGNVGRIVADRALGLKMRVLVHDPFMVEDKIAEAGAIPASFEQILAEADYITIHVPRNDKTLNLIDAAAIAKMKKGVRIINCARGGIANEQALIDGLQSGQVAGVAVDVFPQEPCTDSPLFAQENVVVTPHLGASTGEAQDNVAIMIAEQMIDFLLHGIVKNAVNAPYVEPETLKRMAPVINLAKRVGAMLGQLVDEAPKSMKIFLGGDFANFPASPIRVAILTEYFKRQRGDQEINEINAPYLAQESGIEVLEAKRPHLDDYANVLGVKVTGKSGEQTIQASIPAPGEERIVLLNGYSINLEPEGTMLLIVNKDVPGVVGEVGTLLGRAAINIGQLRLGRIKGESHALMVVTVDGDIDGGIVEELKKLPQVLSARLVRVS